MRPILQPTCFTRVILDGRDDVEIAQLHFVEARIRDSLQHLPEAQRLYIGKALLNLAITRMIASSTVREQRGPT
ncbi:MAG: hypothetical protein ABW034_25635 [Steroidobacteraceae bacterium]